MTADLVRQHIEMLHVNFEVFNSRLCIFVVVKRISDYSLTSIMRAESPPQHFSTSATAVLKLFESAEHLPKQCTLKDTLIPPRDTTVIQRTLKDTVSPSDTITREYTLKDTIISPRDTIYAGHSHLIPKNPIATQQRT
jgi:hypothetical protein